MGCCGNKDSEQRFNPLTDSGDRKKSMIASQIKDPLLKFEKELPFDQLHIMKVVGIL